MQAVNRTKQRVAPLLLVVRGHAVSIAHRNNVVILIFSRL
jgi:hypothetical protein